MIDIVTGVPVPMTPEEVNVQLMAKWLMSIGYSKEQLQTHPRYNIQHNKKNNWIDIGVFEDNDRSKPPIIIVECKKNGAGNNYGIQQLYSYLRKSGAKLGIWFNGQDISYIINIENAANHIKIEKDKLPEIECGAFIRGIREKFLESDKNFSVRGFAKKLGVQPTYISKIEKGNAPISDDMMKRIAEELSIDENHLFARAGRISPEIRDILLARPKIFQELFKTIKDAPEEVIKRAFKKVVRDGDW